MMETGWLQGYTQENIRYNKITVILRCSRN